MESKTDIPRKRKLSSESEELPTPAYGTQEYWDSRYDKNQSTSNDISRSEEAPDPFHSWYFTAEELLPLLLPLILGDDDNECVKEIEDDNADENEDCDDNDNNIVNDGDDVEDAEEYDEDDDDDDSAIIRVGLAKNGPISVLEVGCGNCPLGRDLAMSVEEHGTTIDQDPSGIIRKVICMDYSKNVIDSMKEEQKSKKIKKVTSKIMEKKQIPIFYEVVDARQLPYGDESFEMILEKGTLDAMLSDEDGNGPKNCRMIVSECARVLAIGGYIIIISHLNARVDSGIQWLNDVVVPGLREGGKNCDFQVEVHGNEVSTPSDDEEESPESPGPCVYMIEKIPLSKEEKKTIQSEPSTIPLKFVTY
ncbi:hypothetical protein FRACYDRAFT_234341 [Fragilariopsis cylindrus CCMP1102]|uniref:Methyltransferase domain-containing protein n=1 Tax=Fragilariopsis cylindrus CCMP1102 TaxID=635003 RepID=A0A1E7FRC1_9STRA|nr:hypothetical protein FRACYDRAFT_234341 [Fragilariopsis cylindrus CCMP1102]|eukprot:OEU20709.1 hypothetical protein FRACYDRAFT_234341 [Fragilariopsis cylindrus CCMP1102]